MKFKVVFAERPLDIPLTEMRMDQTGVITQCFNSPHIGDIVKWSSYDRCLNCISGPTVIRWGSIDFSDPRNKASYRVRIVGENDHIKIEPDGTMTVKWGGPALTIPSTELKVGELGLSSDRGIILTWVYEKFSEGSLQFIDGTDGYRTLYENVQVRVLQPGDRIEIIPD